MAASLCSLPLPGAVIYNSISSTAGFSGSTQSPAAIGDLLILASTERLLTQATVAYVKSTSGAGTGTLTVRFYDVGAPFGSLLGAYSADFTAPESGVGAVTFPNLNLLLPDTVGVTASIASNDFINVLVHGPNIAVGSNPDGFYLTTDGTNFTFRGDGGGTIYHLPIRLEAVEAVAPVPEPSTAALMSFGVATALYLARRRKG